MGKELLNILLCLLLAAVAYLDYRAGADAATYLWFVAAMTANAVNVVRNAEMLARNVRGMRAERAESDVFLEFKALHPNSAEEYDPTPDNLQRWRWHTQNRRAAMQESGKMPEWKKPEENKEFTELIRRRRVTDWQDFDALTKAVYIDLARCFIGPVFACGSRVRGDYTQRNDPPEVKAWRRAAGKLEKEVSDFDLFTPPQTKQIMPLPEIADIIRHGIPEAEKIRIPVQEWDFSKLPPQEHARVAQLVRAGQWKELVEIHDRYRLSPYSYCCEIEGLKAWYRHGVQSGQIKTT